MKLLLAILGFCIVTTVRGDISRDLGRLVGWRIADASSVHESQPAKAGGCVVRLLNGQVWHAPLLFLEPIVTDDVVILERNGEYRMLVNREIVAAQLVRGTIGAGVSAAAEPTDEHGVTAAMYEKLARKYDAEDNKELAELARARAAKMRAKR